MQQLGAETWRLAWLPGGRLEPGHFTFCDAQRLLSLEGAPSIL